MPYFKRWLWHSVCKTDLCLQGEFSIYSISVLEIMFAKQGYLARMFVQHLVRAKKKKTKQKAPLFYFMRGIHRSLTGKGAAFPCHYVIMRMGNFPRLFKIVVIITVITIITIVISIIVIFSMTIVIGIIITRLQAISHHTMTATANGSHLADVWTLP